MHRAWLLACGALAVGISAGSCGGRGTLLVGDEQSSSSAASGAGASSTSVNQSSANVVTATSVGPMSAIAVVSSSTGGSQCDNTGDCMSCADCAQNGPCADEVDACAMDMDCSAFIQCFQMCQGTPGCFPQCAQQHPMGAQIYLAAVQCVLCDECPVDCEQFTPPMLCEI